MRHFGPVAGAEELVLEAEKDPVIVTELVTETSL
jgi:hypothetical protein